MIRTTPNKWAVRLGNAYVEFFRNIPLLVQLFLWFFVLPELLPKAMGTSIKQMTPPWASFVPAVIGLGLVHRRARQRSRCAPGSRRCRAARVMAGTAIGLDAARRPIAYVLLPMAYRIIMPPLTSETMNLIKNTSVALTIGLVELTAAARLDAGIHVPGVRGVHGCDGHLHHRQPDRRQPDALARKQHRGPGFIGPHPSPGGPLRWAAFDFGVIERSLRLPVQGGDDLHADADRTGGGGWRHLRHAARDDAAVVAQSGCRCRRPATST